MLTLTVWETVLLKALGSELTAPKSYNRLKIAREAHFPPVWDIFRGFYFDSKLNRAREYASDGSLNGSKARPETFRTPLYDRKKALIFIELVHIRREEKKVAFFRCFLSMMEIFVFVTGQKTEGETSFFASFASITGQQCSVKVWIDISPEALPGELAAWNIQSLFLGKITFKIRSLACSYEKLPKHGTKGVKICFEWV